MGRAARPLHDPGNHRSVERGSNLQAARRGGLMKPAKPAGERENTAALTPSLGTRSTSVLTQGRQRKYDFGQVWQYPIRSGYKLVSETDLVNRPCTRPSRFILTKILQLK